VNEEESMSDPFIGEIKLIAFNYPPKGWAFCNGQLLPINQNQPLFALLGTMYGGNGQTNFALPDLRGKLPIHVGSGFTQGQTGGEYAHTLTSSEMPQHLHLVNAVATAPTGSVPGTGVLLSNSTGTSAYGPAGGLTQMASDIVSNIGGSQPHSNNQPFLVLNFVIALVGIFPSRN